MRAAEDGQYLAYCSKVVEETQAKAALARKRLPLWIGASLLCAGVAGMSLSYWSDPSWVGACCVFISFASIGGLSWSMCSVADGWSARRSHVNCDEVIAQHTMAYKEWLWQQDEKVSIIDLLTERQEVAVSVCAQ